MNQQQSTRLFKQVLGVDFSKTAVQRGLKPDQEVQLYVWNENQEKAVMVGFATTCTGADTSMFRTQLHGHSLQPNLIVIHNITILGSQRPVLYPYTFRTVDDVPNNLNDVQQFCNSGGFVVWDIRAMKPTPSTTDVPQSLSTQMETVVITDDDPDADEVSIVESEDRLEREQNEHGVPFQPKYFLPVDYEHIAVMANIQQVRDFEHPLRPVDNNHVHQLQQRFLDPSIGWQATSGTMSVTLQPEDCTAGASFEDMFDRDASMLVLREQYSITIVDGRHRRMSINNIRDVSNPVPDWCNNRFLFSLIRRKDGNLLSPWEIIMFSKRKNDNSSLVKASDSFADQMYSIFSYSKVFRMRYNINYLEARTIDIAQDMFSTRFLGDLSVVTYRRFVRVSKALLQNESVSNYLLKRSKITRKEAKKQLKVHFLTFDVFLKASKSTMLLMVKCIDGYFGDDTRKKHYPLPFLEACSMFITNLQDYFNRITSTPEQSNLPRTWNDFMNGQYPTSKTITSTPEETLINTMATFNWDVADKGRQCLSRLKGRITKILSKLDSHYFPSGAQQHTLSTKSKTGIVGTKRLVRSRSDRVLFSNNDSDFTEKGYDQDDEQPRKRRRREAKMTAAKSKETVVEVVSSDTDSPDRNSVKNKSAKGGTSTMRNKKNPKPPKNSMDSGSHSTTKNRGTGTTQMTSLNNTAPFDDDFNYNKVPVGWELQHLLFRQHATEEVPEIPFITNVIRHPNFRRDEDETVFDNAHQVSANYNVLMTASDPTVYFRTIHIPANHRAHVFVTLPQFKFYRELAWKFGVFGELSIEHGCGQHVLQTEHNRWAASFQDRFSPIGIAFYNRKKTEIECSGYCILEGFADPFRLSENVINTNLQRPPQLPTLSLEGLWNGVYASFPGEDVLRYESERTNWNPIINSISAVEDRNNRDMGVARYSSTSHLLTRVFEDSARQVPFAERRAHLDVWVGLLVSLLNLHNNGQHRFYMPATGGRFLLNGRNLGPQLPHNDFPLREKKHCPGYFTLVSGAEAVDLWVCPSSHQFVYYSDEEKLRLADILRMTEITIPPFSIFIGHGLLQHAGAAWKGYPGLRYHTYFAPSHLTIPDAIVFAFNKSFKFEAPSRTSNSRSMTARNNTEQTKMTTATSTQPRDVSSLHSNTRSNDTGDTPLDDEEDDFPDPLQIPGPDEDYTEVVSSQPQITDK